MEAIELEVSMAEPGVLGLPDLAPPMLKIRPTRPWALLEAAELWAYRDLLWTLALRDLKLRYRQTALGVLWVVFQPVAGAGIFSIVFGWVAGLSGSGHPYFIYSLAGLLAWNTFQSTLSKSSMSLISQGALVSKVYFPRLLLPFSSVLSTLVDFVIGVIVFVIISGMNGWRPGLSIVQIPFWIMLSLTFAMGGGLLAASLMARFRDIQHVLPMLIPFMMYATPVAYGISGVPASIHWLFEYNPMSWIVEGVRASFLGTEGVTMWGGIYSVVASLVALCVGLLSFRKMERSIADVL